MRAIGFANSQNALKSFLFTKLITILKANLNVVYLSLIINLVLPEFSTNLGINSTIFTRILVVNNILIFGYTFIYIQRKEYD